MHKYLLHYTIPLQQTGALVGVRSDSSQAVANLQKECLALQFA